MVSFNPAITERLNNLANGPLAGHHIFSRDFDDSYLAKRYSKPDAYPHNINYTATTDKKFIDQYLKVRLEAYHSIIGENFYAGYDGADDVSEIFVVTAGNNCIGGVRITFSTPKEPKLLPMEHDGFSIQQQFENLNISKIKYCEASRLALLPDFRSNGEIWDQLQIHSTNYSILEKGTEICFGQSGALQTRRFKAQFKKMGYDLIVHKNVKTSDAEMHEYLNVQFWSVDFTADKRYTNSLYSHSKVSEMAKEIEFA